jgi:hypothetical protein
MSQWTLEQILERREDLRLSWCEPWPASASDGAETHAHVTLTATVDDCIAMARYVHLAREKPLPTEDLTDEVLLGDFVAVHWATVVSA